MTELGKSEGALGSEGAQFLTHLARYALEGCLADLRHQAETGQDETQLRATGTLLLRFHSLCHDLEGEIPGCAICQMLPPPQRKAGLTRRTDTPESAAMWAKVEAAARNTPAWVRPNIDRLVAEYFREASPPVGTIEERLRRAAIHIPPSIQANIVAFVKEYAAKHNLPGPAQDTCCETAPPTLPEGQASTIAQPASEGVDGGVPDLYPLSVTTSEDRASAKRRIVALLRSEPGLDYFAIAMALDYAVEDVVTLCDELVASGWIQVRLKFIQEDGGATDATLL